MSEAAFEGGSEFALGSSGLQFAPAGHTGYDVQATRLGDDRRAAALQRRNAELHDGANFTRFFCPEVELDLNLVGKTAQSPYVRDFYAHNVSIPSLKIKCQCLDQQDYATVIEHIHRSQQKGVQGGGLVQFHLYKGGSDVSYVKGGKVAYRVKGGHKPIIVKGYIKKAPRTYEKFVNQPSFELEFVIAEMLTGIYQEIKFETPEAATWMQIVEGLTKQPKEEVEAKEKEAEFKEEIKKLNSFFEETLDGIGKIF